jgi:putative acetyltransferase
MVTHVRTVTCEDVPAVVELITLVLGEFGLSFGAGSETDEAVRGLPDSYAAIGGAFWVAELGGRIVGTAGVAPLADTPSTFELRKMYLHGSARGTGLGSRLYGEALGFAKARGARRLVLDTTHEMLDAIRFYERKGFVRDDTQIRGRRCSRGYVLELSATERALGAREK